jgi:hypothetical protein
LRAAESLSRAERAAWKYGEGWTIRREWVNVDGVKEEGAALSVAAVF